MFASTMVHAFASVYSSLANGRGPNMRIAYLPLGAALSFMLMLATLPNLVSATGGPGNTARPTRSAAQQLAQEQPSDSDTNSQVDQPDDSSATNDNSDQP